MFENSSVPCENNGLNEKTACVSDCLPFKWKLLQIWLYPSYVKKVDIARKQIADLVQSEVRDKEEFDVNNTGVTFLTQI